jgi:hypothetical protein
MRLLAILLCGLLLGGPAAALTACGNDTKVVTDNGKTRTVPDIKFAKTKFIVNAGLAFGAFHRYILKPYRAGSFRKGAPGRKTAFVKAGVAGLFAYNRLKAARKDAQASDSLRPLVDRMDRAIRQLKSLATNLKGGSLSPGALLGVGAGIAGITGAAKSLGVNVKDRTPPGF